MLNIHTQSIRNFGYYAIVMTLGVDLLEDHALKHAKLLVLDDTEDNLILMKKALMRAGYQNVITGVRPSSPAAEIFQRERPDMVLLDYRMPPVDGFYRAAADPGARDFVPSRYRRLC